MLVTSRFWWQRDVGDKWMGRHQILSPTLIWPCDHSVQYFSRAKLTYDLFAHVRPKSKPYLIIVNDQFSYIYQYIHWSREIFIANWLRIPLRQGKISEITQIKKVLKYFLLRILRDSMDCATISMRGRQRIKIYLGFERARINISL